MIIQYCRVCGSSRPPSDLFCATCGNAYGPAQGNLSPANLVPVNPLARRFAVFAACLAIFSAVLFSGLLVWAGNYFPSIEKTLMLAPLVLAVALLLGNSSYPQVGAGLPIAAFGFIVSRRWDYFLDHGDAGTLQRVLLIVSLAVAAAATVLVARAVTLTKPSFSTPRATLGVAAAVAVVFSIATFLPSQSNYSPAQSILFLVVIVASVSLGCLLDGWAAASVGIVGATFFGLMALVSQFTYLHIYAESSLFEVLACAAFIAIAIIGWSARSREESVGSVDPRLIER